MAEIRLINIKETSSPTTRLSPVRSGMPAQPSDLSDEPDGLSGRGKTSLILQTLRRLKDKFRMAVIEGDIDSQVDAEKVIQEDIPRFKSGRAVSVILTRP